MLKSLKIRNYALIRDLDIYFRNKLNTITGETGAGKSIMLGALGLILGKLAASLLLSLLALLPLLALAAVFVDVRLAHFSSEPRSGAVTTLAWIQVDAQTVRARIRIACIDTTTPSPLGPKAGFCTVASIGI
jgi:hypothetical protein